MTTPRSVSLVAVPEASAATLFGIFDVMSAFSVMGIKGPGAGAPFEVEIVGESAGPLTLASGVAVQVERIIESVEASDIVIVTSVVLPPGGTVSFRSPARPSHAAGGLSSNTL